MSNYIELEQNAKQTIDKLNELLANMQVYYQNLRGFHWNIKGENFFELHLKFEEYYTAAALNIDEVAERILTIGGSPLHCFDDYLKNSEIRPEKNVSDGKAGMNSIWNMHNLLLTKMREVVKHAAEQGDEGTQDVITPMINILEKTNWMVGAWLRK
jgi:starvation-inducible DNA-binding protein